MEKEIIVKEVDGSERVIEHGILFEITKTGMHRTFRNVNAVDIGGSCISLIEFMQKRHMLELLVSIGLDDDTKDIMRRALRD